MILFSLAVLAELAFWLGGIDSQLSEVWLVLVAVPLLMHFASPKAKATPKKIVDDADEATGKAQTENTKKTAGIKKSLPSGKNGMKPVVREVSPFDAERAVFKQSLTSVFKQVTALALWLLSKNLSTAVPPMLCAST